MIKLEVSYICDCCGKKESYPAEIGERGGDGWAPYNVVKMAENEYEDCPKSWRTISPYGLCCEKCVSEFNNVYERIHAPEKAKQMYRDVIYS